MNRILRPIALVAILCCCLEPAIAAAADAPALVQVTRGGCSFPGPPPPVEDHDFSHPERDMGNWLLVSSHYQVGMISSPTAPQLPLDDLAKALLTQMASATSLEFDLDRMTADSVGGHPARRVPHTSSSLPASLEGRVLLWVDAEARRFYLWRFSPNATRSGEPLVPSDQVDAWTDGARGLFDCSGSSGAGSQAPDWTPPTSDWATHTEANSRTWAAPSRDRSLSLGLIPAGTTVSCEQHVGVLIASVEAARPGLVGGSPTITKDLPGAGPGKVRCEAEVPMSLDGRSFRYRFLVLGCPAPSTLDVQATERDFTEAADSWLSVEGAVTCPDESEEGSAGEGRQARPGSP